MLIDFLIAAIHLYTIVLIVRALLSWLSPERRRNQFYEFLHAITEPALRPVRRVLPAGGGIDWSPLVLLLALHLAARVLRGFQ